MSGKCLLIIWRNMYGEERCVYLFLDFFNINFLWLLIVKLMCFFLNNIVILIIGNSYCLNFLFCGVFLKILFFWYM